MTTETERRKTPRYKLHVAVRYSQDGKKYESAHTADASLDGLYIVSQNHVRAGTTLTLDVELPSGVVELNGTVRWWRKLPATGRATQLGGVGVRITRAPDIWYQFVSELTVQAVSARTRSAVSRNR